MNLFKYICCIAFITVFITGCKKMATDDVSFVSTASAPEKPSAFFDITQDNTGLVTITPNGEGVASYDVYYGDATPTFVKVAPGKNTQHTYAEGVYTVKIVAHGITGKTTEVTQQLTVSFKAPENVEVTAAIDAANKFKVNVTAKALYETVFKVTFGDVVNEVAQSLLEGQTLSHTYTTVGTYTIKVVAQSGGSATTTVTKTVTIVDPVLLPINFESGTVSYAFGNFDGGNSTVITNPQSKGINTSTKVARMIKSAGQPWGGSAIALGSSVDFSPGKIFRMKVYSPRVGAKVLFKIENAANSALNFEKEVATTVANTWEDLVFDFSTVNTSNTYQNIVIIFELGTQGDGSANFTFLYDDIRLTNTLPSSAQINLPVTFDDASVNYTVTDFGNNQTIDGVDPANAANKVKITTKITGAETWAGTTIGTPAGFASAIPFTATATQMSMRVYSPAAGLRIRLKVEDRTNNTKTVETEAVIAAANTWETLVFDFSKQATGTAALNLGTTYNMSSVFFDFGNAGTGKKFYWDDVKFLTTNTTPDVLGIPLTFESSTLTYAFTDFGGGVATVINNPNKTGINTSNKVGKMVKGTGEVYGGSFITLAGPIDFSTKKSFKMKVFSPKAGTKVLLKVENLTNGALNFEKEVTTTTANAWEEITFDYSTINTANTYHKVVLIFDFGTVGDGSANFTYLFDDITLN